MKKIQSSHAAIFLLLASYIILGIALFNADFLYENEANKFSNLQPITWLDYAIEKNLINFLFGLKALPVLAIFLAPMLVIMQGKQIKIIKYVFLELIMLLFFLNVYQFFKFEGGDYKGCFECEIYLLIHILFGLISLLVAISIFAFIKTTRN